MSESIENKDQVVVETQEEVKTPELTPIEQKAMEMGWRPKEEFDGDDEDFIDAKEFVRRKPLFDKIDTSTRQVKQLTKALDAFKEHYSRVNEAAYERALKALKAERQTAVTNGDGERFEALDEQIKEVEEQAEQIRQVAQPTPVEQSEHPEFSSWKARNSWYEKTGYMRAYADQLGKQLHSQGLQPQEVLREVEKAVRKEFPQKFTNPNKASAPSVETSGGSAKRGGGGDGFELSDQERKVMNDLVRSKQMTKEEYIASLKLVKGIA